MKKHLIILLAMGLAVAAMGQKTTVGCTFSGLADGSRIIVAEAQGNILVPVDTLMPDAKGRVKIERYSPKPELITLGLDREQSPMVHLILLPKERMTLDLVYLPDLNHFDITAAKGSDNMALYKEFINLTTTSLQQQQPAAVGEGLADILGRHPDRLMSAFLVTFYEQAFDQYAPLYKKIRDALIDTYPDNPFVLHLDNRLRTALLPGTPAPDIAMADSTGQTRRLSDLRGKVVLIDFWASWCRPCRMENPNVVRLYQRFHDKGFEIFSVSLDQSREAWLKAIHDDHLSWPHHVSDLRGWNSAAGRLYGIQSIPATVLLDREGNIVARNLRGQELEKKLTEIFAQ